MFRIAIFALLLLTAGALWYQQSRTDVRQDTEMNATSTAEVSATKAVTLSATTSRERIVGTWQSTDDPASVVVFDSQNVVVNRYNGEDIDTGTWKLETRDDASYNPSGVFLVEDIDGESFEYAVIEISNDTLRLNYLDRGNMLRYSRVEVQ